MQQSRNARPQAANTKKKKCCAEKTSLAGVRFDVPVEDAADKRRDESATELRGGDSLSHAEHEREVAGDALLLQHLKHHVTVFW
jgi:hypothetical protein